MKAIALSKTGGPGVLKVSEQPDPSISKPTEVLVRMKAAGLNYAEIMSRRGDYRWIPPRPYVLGLEGAGIVEEVGSEVSSVEVGDPVMVGVQHGSYAQYLVADESSVFRAFDGFSMSESAAFPISFMTACFALRDSSRVRPGESLLVQAAAGGLGTAAVQLGHAMDQHVAGTSSQPRKLEFLESKLGIELALNYREKGLVSRLKEWTNGRGVNTVLESVGGEAFKNSMKVLAPTGRVVLVGATSITYNKWNPFSLYRAWKALPRVNVLRLISWSHGVMGLHLGWIMEKQRWMLQETMDYLLELVEEHGIRPVIDQEFELANAGEAHLRMERRENIGKVIIKIP